MHYVIILETCSYVQYFSTQINNNQTQSELFHNMLGSSLQCFRYWPFKRAVMMLMLPPVNMSLTLPAQEHNERLPAYTPPAAVAS